MLCAIRVLSNSGFAMSKKQIVINIYNYIIVFQIPNVREIESDSLFFSKKTEEVCNLSLLPSNNNQGESDILCYAIVIQSVYLPYRHTAIFRSMKRARERENDSVSM